MMMMMMMMMYHVFITRFAKAMAGGY